MVVSWDEFSAGGADDGVGVGEMVVVWECGLVDADVVGSVYGATHAALGVLQSWLAVDRVGVLVIVTRGAVGVGGAGCHRFGGCGGVGVGAFGAK